MLLADSILADKSSLNAEKKVIELAQIVRADNVGELYFDKPEEWVPADFPNVMLPWPVCWIECTSSNAISPHTSRWGALFVELPLDDIDPTSSTYKTLAEHKGWHAFNTRMFLSVRKSPPCRVLDGGFVVDERGIIVKEHSEIFPLINVDLEVNEYIQAFLSSLLLAVSFLNCKNVTRVDAPISKIDNSRNWRKHHRPLLTHKTLVVDHLKQILRTEGGMESGNSLKRALHICRGHFSHYTPEKPLFGKVVGTFWVPQHVRGNATSGVIEKDYVVR